MYSLVSLQRLKHCLILMILQAAGLQRTGARSRYDDVVLFFSVTTAVRIANTKLVASSQVRTDSLVFAGTTRNYTRLGTLARRTMYEKCRVQTVARVTQPYVRAQGKAFTFRETAENVECLERKRRQRQEQRGSRGG